MTDVSPFSQPIQAPSAPPPGAAPVDSLFATPPGSEPAVAPPQGGSGSALDALFGASPPVKTGQLADLSASVAPMGRILNAFGQGAAHQWGSKPSTPGPVTAALNGIEGGKEVADRQSGLLKGFNEAFLRPAAAVLDNTIRAGTNILPSMEAGLQAEAAQTLKEEGPGVASGLTRALVAATIPPQHADIAAARATGAIGEGEASYFGAQPPTPDQLRERAVAAQEANAGGVLSPLERMNMSIAQYKATGGPLGDIGRALERDFDNIADIRAKKAEAATSGDWLDYAKQSGLEAYARVGSVMDTVFPAVSEPIAQAVSHVTPEAGTFQRFVPSTINAEGQRIPAHTVAAAETPETKAEASELVGNLASAAVPLGWAGKALKLIGLGAKTAEGGEAARAAETSSEAVSEGAPAEAAAPAQAAPAEAAAPAQAAPAEAAAPAQEAPTTLAKPQPPSIDELARKVDPQTFDQWDSLQLARDQQREEIARLGEARATSPETLAARDELHQALGLEPGETLSPEALDERIQAVAASAGEEHLSRIGEAYDRHDALLTADTPQMAAARERLTDIDITLGRLGPQVSTAYRHAEDLLPEAEGAAGEEASWTPEKEAQFQQGQQVLQSVAARDAEAAAPNVAGAEKPGVSVGGNAEPQEGGTQTEGTPQATPSVESVNTVASKAEPPAGRTGSLRPVQGSGEELPRGLSVSAEAGAIDKGLTEGFGELPTYNVAQNEAQGAKVVELMNKDAERAEQIAMGERAPPPGVLANAVYVGVYNRAEAAGDVELMERLGTRSKLVAASTTMGQNIQILSKLNAGSFLPAIRDLKAAKEAEYAARSNGVPLDVAREQTIANDAKALAAEEKAVAPKADRLAAFIDTIRCT